MLSKAGLNFPVILGAHDHDFIVKGGEHGSSCLVVKVGSDAYKAAVIDVSWKDDISKECSVQMRFEDVGSYKKDMVVDSKITFFDTDHWSSYGEIYFGKKLILNTDIKKIFHKNLLH